MKEAMKLALEALESCDAAHITDGGHQWYDEKLVDTAITALREAMAEQPAPVQKVGTIGHIDNGKATLTASILSVLKAAPQPAQQEPVAVHQFRKRGCSDWYDGHPDHTDGGGPYEARTLYTSPPARNGWTTEQIAGMARLKEAQDKKLSQRTWVGLTDEEKAELDAEYGDDTLSHLDAIEAKLKEKNT